jgi:hypothetical protein
MNVRFVPKADVQTGTGKPPQARNNGERKKLLKRDN